MPKSIKIRTKTVNSDFNQAFDYLAEVFGVKFVGGKLSVWIDRAPMLPRSSKERQKLWANIVDAIITVNVLAERGSVDMTRQQDYQGRSLGFFVNTDLVEKIESASMEGRAS